MGPKRKSPTDPIRTIPPPILQHQSRIPEIVKGENRSHHGRVGEYRTRDPKVISLLPVHAERNLSQVQSEEYHNQSFYTRVEYLNFLAVKPRSHCGAVVKCRTRDWGVPSSNPGADKKKISHQSNQKNTTTNLSAPELNTWNCQRWKPEDTVVQVKSPGLENQWFLIQIPVRSERKSPTDPIRTIPPPILQHQSGILENVRDESRSHHGTVVECRIRYPKVQSWILVQAKRNLSQLQSEQYHHQSLCTRVKYLKLSEVQTRSYHGAVVYFRSRDAEETGANIAPCKEIISHWSSQNNTTTNPSATLLNTWKRQKWKLKPLCAGLQTLMSPVEIPVQAKWKSLTGPIRTIPFPIPHHKS